MGGVNFSSQVVPLTSGEVCARGKVVVGGVDLPVGSSLSTSSIRGSSFTDLFKAAPIPRDYVSGLLILLKKGGYMAVRVDPSTYKSGLEACKASVKGCFAIPLDHVFAFEVELLATSIAINFAWQNEWHWIWLESDSSYVVQLLSSRTEQVPWWIRQAWQCCIYQISKMEFQVSHIFREGNQVADALSKHALVRGRFVVGKLPVFLLFIG
ncbi:hypothetical protein Ddye_008511 [Dipteronia dyeriana]|uniref:RNase H type-1 domain-containing protein n=1 Tax=Dipteronia dyeriana TaxID=168575 RepID=A0AAD9X9Q1_9ROSI|nr:hypothetical protein Ddye_008511 [Dipteronia dyeriana]